MADNPDDDGLLNMVEDRVIGKIVKQVASDGIGDIQDQGRIVVERLFQRNAIFAAKVQQNNRINIPQAEVEKLDIEPGEVVQVALTPIEKKQVDEE